MSDDIGDPCPTDDQIETNTTHRTVDTDRDWNADELEVVMMMLKL